MANVIRHKRGTSDPVAGDFSDTAELLINTTDGGLFTKTDGGSVVEIGAGGGASAINDLSDAYAETAQFGSIGLGTGALANDDGSNRNVAVGYNAGNAITSGIFNTAVGYSALDSLTTAQSNTAIGYTSLFNATTGHNNTAVGSFSLDALTTGGSNVAIGASALSALTTADNNVCVGHRAGESLTTGAGNVAIGHQALQDTADRTYTTAVGYRSLANLTTGNHSGAFGAKSLESVTTGSFNLGLGSEALSKVTTTSQNVAVGAYAGRYIPGSSNTFVGYSAGEGVSGTSSSVCSYNTGVGEKSFEFITTGLRNTGLGYQALRGVTTGQDNTAIGYLAGYTGTNNLTTGGNNTIIGYNASPSSATVSNEITLGNSSVTSLRIPGLQSGATDGQVLTYNSTNGNITLADAAGGGGLTEFVESQDTSSPNATVPVDALTATDASYTNIDVALVPKGTGAFLAEVPDGSAAGGNKRGANAVDLQTDRSSSAHVASGANSVVVGGERNRATAGHSTVLGGFTNTASGGYSICGGYTCTAGGGGGSVVLGYLSDGSGAFGSVIGYDNSSTASYGHVIGSFHTVTGQGAACIGGFSSTADAELSIVIGARDGDARSTVGKAVIPACKSPIAFGDGLTQSAILVLGRETTDATTTTLASNTSTPGSTNQLFLDNNTAYYFKGSVIAGVTGAGDTKAWTFEGAIKRGASASTTAIVGSVVLNTIAYDSGAAAWDVDITADTTNGCLKVEVTGAASTTIRWVAKIESTEMGF